MVKLDVSNTPHYSQWSGALFGSRNVKALSNCCFKMQRNKQRGFYPLFELTKLASLINKKDANILPVQPEF